MSTNKFSQGNLPALQNPAAALFGETRQRVLGWLLTQPDRAFYVREVIRLSGGSHGAVQRELNKLTDAGILRRTARGRQVYFQANRESPIYPELHSLMIKTAGVRDVIRQALRPLQDRIEVAFIFGSAARGQLSRESDIDLIVVGSVSFADVVEALDGTRERIGREVNPVIYRPEELAIKRREGRHFLTSLIDQPRIYVIGGPDELAGLGAERLATGSQNEPG